MRKVGDIFTQDNMGAKAFYKVTSVDENGMEVAELLVGYVPPTTGEDIIETVKSAKKSTASASASTTTKKKVSK